MIKVQTARVIATQPRPPPDVSKHGPLPHLPARSFQPHRSRVFRRVWIGCRGGARGSHTAGTVGRGRSLERRPPRRPSKPRGPAPLGPAAEGVESRASRQQSSPAEHHATCGRRHYPSTAPLTRRQPSQEEPDDRAGDYARDEQGQQPLK